MSVIGGILLFTAGAALGGGAVIFNRYCIRRETEPLRRENEHMRDSAWSDLVKYRSDEAYREGYYDGSRHPLSDVEKFADLLERHKIDYRFPKEDARRDRSERKTTPRSA